MGNKTPSCLSAAITVLLLAAPAGPAMAQGDDVDAREGAATSSHDTRDLGEGLWVSGLTVLASTYVITGVAATTLVVLANVRDDTIYQSWIPVLGPWLMLADSAGFDDLQIGATVVSGIVQAVSLGFLIAGLVLVFDSDESGGERALGLAPLVNRSGGGLNIAGTF